MFFFFFFGGGSWRKKGGGGVSLVKYRSPGHTKESSVWRAKVGWTRRGASPRIFVVTAVRSPGDIAGFMEHATDTAAAVAANASHGRMGGCQIGGAEGVCTSSRC